MALVAGTVQGTFAQAFDLLWLKTLTGIAAVILLLMAGAISARRSVLAATVLGLTMGGLFFVGRWGAWAFMSGGLVELSSFVASGPVGWPDYLFQSGISAFWIFEAMSMLAPSIAGCLMGQERPE